MDESTIKKLEKIVTELNEIHKKSIVNYKSLHFIEFIKEKNTNALILSANTEGFVYLAYRMLNLAVERKQYMHDHFDEYSMLSNNDSDLIVQYYEPPEIQKIKEEL